MQIQVFKNCQQTQNKEEYICTNKTCLNENKKQLHCYPCLAKMHRDKKQKIAHLDDFMELQSVIQQVTQKRDQRLKNLLLVQQKVFDFQKEKKQQIQKHPFHTTEYLEQIIAKVEEETGKFMKYIGEHFALLNKVQFYSQENHKAIVEIFHSNEQQQNSIIQSKLHELFSNINKYLSQQDLNLHETLDKQRKQYQELEKKIQSIEKPYQFNKFMVLIQIIIIAILLNFFFQNSQNQTEKQFILKDEDQLINSIKDIVKTRVLEIQVESAQQMEILSQKYLDEMKKDLEYLKLFNQKLKVEFLEFQQNYKEQFQAQIQINNKLQQKIEILSNHQQSQQDQISQINENFQIQNQTTIQASDPQFWNQISTSLNVFDERIGNVTKKLNNSLEEIQDYVNHRIQINRFYFLAQYYLVGKIHDDYPFVLLQGFTKYYDEDFTKPFTVEKIYALNQLFDRQSIVCIGGSNTTQPTRFMLMACDYAFEVFAETFSTEKARKSRTGDELYWYVVRNHAIGFAPNQNIDLRLVDDYNITDTRRFSHLLDHKHGGGRRIGDRNALAYSVDYRMVIFAID